VKALHAKIGELTLENDFLEVAHPRHPFETLGFTSVGCIPCTSRPASGTSVRSGRWSGLAKTECGIHTRTTYGPDRLEPYGEPVRDYRISATGMEPGPWQMGCHCRGPRARTMDEILSPGESRRRRAPAQKSTSAPDIGENRDRDDLDKERQGAVVETDIPARLDGLPWGRFHTLVVVALGITWILDGLEVTLTGALSRRSQGKCSGIALTTRETSAAVNAVFLVLAEPIVRAIPAMVALTALA
jgi:hypothetical protein